MSDELKLSLIIVAFVLAFIAIVWILLAIVDFFVTHPLISGLIMGLVIGSGGTFIGMRVYKWLRMHHISLNINEREE